MNELMQKPSFSEEIIVEIPKVPEVKHNLQGLKDYAVKLSKFYNSLVLDINDEKTIKDIETERTKINNFVKSISNLRKEKVKEYKEPIDSFESTAKEVESLLKEVSENFTSKLNMVKEKRAKEKMDNFINPTINKLLSEAFVKGYLIDKELIVIDEKWFNKTAKDNDIIEALTNQVQELINIQEQEKRDIAIINQTLDNFKITNKDVYFERYKYTKDLQGILMQIQSVAMQNMEKPVEKPVVNTTSQEPLVTISFKGTASKIATLRDYAIKLGLEEL